MVRLCVAYRGSVPIGIYGAAIKKGPKALRLILSLIGAGGGIYAFALAFLLEDLKYLLRILFKSTASSTPGITAWTLPR